MDATSNSKIPGGDLSVSSEVVQTLREVGYVATVRGLPPQAESIYSGELAASPASELPRIGLAVCKVNLGYIEDAAKIRSEWALPINPDSEMAKCFLASQLKHWERNKKHKI
jgi:hypothetical protein